MIHLYLLIPVYVVFFCRAYQILGNLYTLERYNYSIRKQNHFTFLGSPYNSVMIYIFGGAFDPPHVGHTSIVKAILHYKNPEKIIIIPSSVRNDKSYAVSDDHRLAMLDIFCDELNESIEKDQSIGNTALSSE